MIIIKILSALLTPVIAIFAAYIGYKQYTINKKNSERLLYMDRRKMDLDLYKSRYKIFDETKNVLLKISKNAGIDIIEVRDYNFSINESKFLFEEDIVNFLQELQRKAIDLTHITKELENKQELPVNSIERNNKVKEWKVLIDFFTHEYQNLESRFIKYLDFRKI